MSNRKRLISNFLSLSTVQLAGYIFPLLTVPYLLRVLGPDKFGLISFAQAITQYFVMLSDYGFNLTAVRAISVNREDHQKVSEIYCSVMLIKIALLTLCFLILILLCLSVSKFREDVLVYVLTFGIAIGGILFPTWLFQGLEKMKMMAMLSFFPKVFFTLMIFLFIRTKDDYIYHPAISSLGFLLTGLISIWIIAKKFRLTFQVPSKVVIVSQLKDGFYVFISMMGNSLYSTSNVFILGLLTNNLLVGYFSAAEKIVRAVSGFMLVTSQTIYPFIGKLVSESKDVALAFARKALFLIGIPNLLISSVLLLFAKQIGDIVFGAGYGESVVLLRILSFLPFVGWLGNFCTVQIMLNFNLTKPVSKIFISAGLFNLLMLFPLVSHYQHYGTAWSLLVTECYITIVSMTYVQTHDLKIIGRKI